MQYSDLITLLCIMAQLHPKLQICEYSSFTILLSFQYPKVAWKKCLKFQKNPLIVGEKYKFTLVKQDFIFLKIRKHMRREKCITFSEEERKTICLEEQELEKAMAPHSSTLAWKIPWTEETGRLQSMGWLRVRHD